MENKYPTYNPNDIESLLEAKNFEELTDSEKTFALENVSSAAEYNEIRSTLIHVKSSFVAEEELVPDSAVQESLMAEFNRLHSRPQPTSFWKNFKTKLFPSGQNLFYTPGFQLAGVAVVVVVVGLFFLTQNSTTEKELALNNKDEDRLEVKTTPESELRSADERNGPVEDNIQPDLPKSEESIPVKDAETLSSRIVTEKTVEDEKSLNDDVTDKSLTFANREKEIVATTTTNNTGDVLNESAYKKDNFSSTENVKGEKNKASLSKSEKRADESKKSKSTVNGATNEPSGYVPAITESDNLKSNLSKETPGVSLGEKPELIELLFTTL